MLSDAKRTHHSAFRGALMLPREHQHIWNVFSPITLILFVQMWNRIFSFLLPLSGLAVSWQNCYVLLWEAFDVLGKKGCMFGAFKSLQPITAEVLLCIELDALLPFCFLELLFKYFVLLMFASAFWNVKLKSSVDWENVVFNGPELVNLHNSR